MVALEGRLDRALDAIQHERQLRELSEKFVAKALEGAAERDRLHFEALNHAKESADKDRAELITKKESGLRMILWSAGAAAGGPGIFEVIKALIANQ